MQTHKHATPGKKLNEAQIKRWDSIRAHLERAELMAAYEEAVALNQELLDEGVDEFPPLYEELLSTMAIWKVAHREAAA